MKKMIKTVLLILSIVLTIFTMVYSFIGGVYTLCCFPMEIQLDITFLGFLQAIILIVFPSFGIMLPFLCITVFLDDKQGYLD